jgi:hypothetical protein
MPSRRRPYFQQRQALSYPRAILVRPLMELCTCLEAPATPEAKGDRSPRACESDPAHFSPPCKGGARAG